MSIMIPLKHGFLETPSSNTGSDRQDTRGQGFGYTADRYRESKCTKISAHLDFLTVVGTCTSITPLEAAVWAAFGTKFDWSSARPGTVGKYYECLALSPIGVTICLNTIESTQQIEYRLSIPGKPLSHICPVRLHEFGKFLLQFGARATRFDWAIDDFCRTLNISTVYGECLRGNRHGFVYCEYRASGKKGEKNMGETLYLGHPDTEHRARIYDKNVESNGEINAIRFEAQTRDRVADSFFRNYFGCNDIIQACERASKRSIGKYRFVYPVSDVLSRCPDLPWWAEFVRLVGGQVKVSVPRMQPMISDKKRWVESQVCGTLALIFKCTGIVEGAQWLFEEIQKKAEKNKEFIENYVDTWKDRRKVATQKFPDCMDAFFYEKAITDIKKHQFSVGLQCPLQVSKLNFLPREVARLSLFRPSDFSRQLDLFSSVF